MGKCSGMFPEPVRLPALAGRCQPMAAVVLLEEVKSGGVEMSRAFFLVTLAALALGFGTSAAGAASSGEFKAQFQDSDCTTHFLCGTGLVEGYGHVTTTLDRTGGDFDPSTGCLVNVTAVRKVELASDASSSLTLEVTDGVICGNKGSATFTITAATGAFAGLAVLPGTVRLTLIPGVPADVGQYRATIAA